MPHRLQRRYSERLVIGGLVLAVALLALTNLAAVRALTAASGYLAGVALWAQGRQAATLHLVRYALTDDAGALPKFEAAVAVPLHFRAARLALDQPQPDRAAARRSLLAAGNHADDVEPMIELFVHFRALHPMAQAIAVWAEGDAGIDQLLQTAGVLRGTPPGPARTSQLAVLNGNDARLTALEARFAQLMGEALRQARQLATALTLALAALLAVACAWVTGQAFKRIHAGERALRESHQRWVQAARAANVEMFEWNVASDRMVRHRGSGSEVTTLAAYLAGLPEADRERTRAELEQARAAGSSYASEHADVADPDGSPRWVSMTGRFARGDDGQAVSLLGMRADITERKRAQAALAASELRFRTLLETAPDAVVVLDERSHIEYVNAAVQRVFGWDPAELIGRPIDLLQPPALRRAHQHGLDRYMRTGVRRVDWRATETQGLHRNGETFALEVSFSHLQVEGRHRFAGFLRDISGRKAAEAARNELEAQLRQAQKMESLGQLAGGVAHDFNNIVGAILGNVVLARDDLPAGHPALASVEQISRAALRARELVGQILAFSRRQPVQLAVQPLQPIVRGILQLLRPTLPAAVELRAELDDTPLLVQVDRSQIEQVVMNLCTNAWHAARGAAPQIVVGVQRHSASAGGPGPAGDWAQLWVADNGQGMDAATRERVFEPFFTTKPVGRGTGLGLSLVHGIVAAHRGAITVASQPGVGSRFDVYLPLAAPGSTEAPPSAGLPDQARPAGCGQHVLYVDDDELMRLMMERLLERDGYRVSVVAGAAEALQALAARDTDLLLTDFNMPDTTGLQLARQALQAQPGLPVVMVSGDISAALGEEAAALGIAALVQKAHCFDQLPGVLAQVLAERSGPPARRAPRTPPMIYNESQRLAALRGLEVLDSDAEPLFDAITRLACELCEAPMGLLSLVDEERQWFKAGIGLGGLPETPREIALCAHTIVTDDVMVVNDAGSDERFVDNPLITGPPYIRLYAGAPLILPGGERVGTLSVLDRQPRSINERQKQALRSLAAIATQALLMRRDLRRQASAPVALLGHAV